MRVNPDDRRFRYCPAITVNALSAHDTGVIFFINIVGGKAMEIMKKFVFCTLILVCAAAIFFSLDKDKPAETLKLYIVDAEMLHLIPTEITVRKTDVQGAASDVIAALIRGFDDNPKIRRLIPKIRGCMSVKVKGNTAYVNISEAMIKNHPDGRDLERLTVYSVVNSLTSISGIENVQFTINGKIRRDFMGYMDMRGAFAFEKVV